MKRLAILLFTTLVLGLCFTACDKEKDKPTLVGKWESTHKVEKRYKNNAVTHDQSNNIPRNDGNYFTYEFKQDNSYTFLYDGHTITGSYRVADNKLYLKVTGTLDEEAPWDYSIDDNQLTLFQKEEYTYQNDSYRVETTYSLTKL